MREPGLVPAAIFAPGHCMICGGSYGQMIDTRVDIPGDGRMYICMQVCLPQILALLEGQTNRRCSEFTLSGEPCRGKALPDRPYCVAHSKLYKEEEEEDERLVGTEAL